MKLEQKRSARKVRRAVKRNKLEITVVICVIIITATTFLLFGHKQTLIQPKQEVKHEAKYEITSTDIFSLDHFNVEEISVKGIMLDDKFDDVIKKIGAPDTQKIFPPNVLNIEYGEQLNMTGIGLILHFENQKLKRITFREPFNKYLVEQTKINHTKEEILHMFRKPNKVLDVIESKTSPLVYRSYVYQGQGLQIIMSGEEEVGFTLEKRF